MQLCCALWLCFCVYLPCVAEALVKPCVECAFPLWCASVFILLSCCFRSTEARWPIRDGDRACCSVLRVNAPVQLRRTSTLTLVLICRWTHLIPPLTPHSPFVPETSCPDPNIDPQVDQAYLAPHQWQIHHGFNYNISKTSLLYRLSLICF